MQKTLPFYFKLLSCLLAGLIVGASTGRIASRFIIPWVPRPFIWGGVAVILLATILYPIYWQIKEKNQPELSSNKLAFWQGVMRYFIALDLSMFGWQKFFHLQFFTPLGVLDEPFSSFTGEQLTWAYFGHSYPFICVIGSMQILGAYLLLFQRTRLIGVFVLIPVLTNIIFIDFFYGLPLGVQIHAWVMMAGVLYLLFMEYDRLVEFFLRAKNVLPTFGFKSIWSKNLLRFSVLCIPLLLIGLYEFPDKHPELTGKYSVQKLEVNHRFVGLSNCQDSVLTIVYMDLADDFVFEFNDQKKRLIGAYHYNPENGDIRVKWRYPVTQKDDFRGKLSKGLAQNDLLLEGVMGRDTFKIQLQKHKKD